MLWKELRLLQQFWMLRRIRRFKVKIDFGRVLKSLTGEDIQEMGLESTILKKATECVPGRLSWTLAEAAQVLDQNGVKVGDILTARGLQFTLGALCADVLVSQSEIRDEAIDGRELIRRFKLANKVFKPKEKGLVPISSEEVVLIRKLIVKAKDRYSVLITGQALSMLDDSEEEKG